ncbi:MAG: response regulator transcription factor [Phycisphaeraceae bacterium]
MRLLVIEDNPKYAAALEKGLTSEGFTVEVASRGHDGEDLAAVESYDVIILDLMLPDHDGVRLCQNLRRRGVETPVLMVTSLTDTRDKVSGLEAGADDYVTKPFDFQELVARVRVLLRRSRGSGPAVLEYGDLTLDLTRHEVERAEQPIDLTHKEFTLLEYFMRNPDRVLTRTAIGEHVWDMNFDPFSNVIDVYVSMLRRKIDKPFDEPLIHTVIGSGYRFGSAP